MKSELRKCIIELAVTKCVATTIQGFRDETNDEDKDKDGKVRCLSASRQNDA